jgi:hypothetical protein
MVTTALRVLESMCPHRLNTPVLMVTVLRAGAGVGVSTPAEYPRPVLMVTTALRVLASMCPHRLNTPVLLVITASMELLYLMLVLLVTCFI